MRENEKIEKDVFTRENVIYDIKNIAKLDIGGYIFGIIFVSIIYLIMIAFIRGAELSFPIKPLFRLIIYLVIIFFLVLGTVRQIRLMHKVSKGDFVITSAVLTDWRASHSDLPVASIGTSMASPPLNKLSFEGYETFSIPDVQHYKWSKKHTMDAKAVRDYSLIGDEFYIAVINNKIYSVYNKKLFEYKE